jgi:hypothetical protein
LGIARGVGVFVVIRYNGLIRDAARQIASAAEASLDDLKTGLVEQEPHLTDRMLGRMAQVMDGYKAKGVTWSAKTLTDHGPNTQEKEYGPDFVGVLEINIPGYKVKKGFLAQAKLTKSDKMNRSDFDRLIDQCKRMLDLSTESFVFHYSFEGIRVIPAIAVLAASGPSAVFDPDGLYFRRISTFYEDHFECFVGDMRISEASERTLEQLRARSLLSLVARSE